MKKLRLKKVVPGLQEELNALKKEIHDAAPEWMQETIRRTACRVVDLRRGRANYTKRTATVPLWAWQKGYEYRHWYLAHELSHHIVYFNGGHRGHSGPFQDCLKRITRFAHFELGYKPRLAAAAGITQPVTELPEL